MAAYPKVSAGITLIELLVVMTIMMSALAIVGGVAVGSIPRAQAQMEVISLHSLLKKSSVEAFSSGRPVVLRFARSNVNVDLDGMLHATRKFHHLTFDDEVVSFNRNGLANVRVIFIDVRGKKRRLDIAPFFNNLIEDDSGLQSNYE